MANLEAVVRGNEQLILLPIQAHTYTLPTDDSVVVELNPGMLSAVMSGYAGITGGGDDRSAILADGDGFLLRVSDDEQVFDDTVTWLVGPVWRDLVQFSANVSPAGIISLDSDEVDHSSWELAETKARAVSADGGERIELSMRIKTQGEGNGWLNFAYQVVATGSLRRMPTADQLSADI